MTINTIEHNGNNLGENHLFDLQSIETMANLLYQTPPEGNNIDSVPTLGIDQVSIPPLGYSQTPNLETLKSSEQQFAQIPTITSDTNLGLTPGDSPYPITSREITTVPTPQTPIEADVPSSFSPLSLGEISDRSNKEVTPFIGITPIPSVTESDQQTAKIPQTDSVPTQTPNIQSQGDVPDDVLTLLAQQLYAQIPSLTDNIPQRPLPTSQGISTVFPLREEDLQTVLTDLALGGVKSSSSPQQEIPTETPTQNYYFLSPKTEENIGLESGEIFDVNAIRQDFPILHQKVNGKQLVWLDNAATTQKPQAVIDALSYYYQNDNSNVHRGAHTLAARATDGYESAREKVQRFLGAADVSEIIFARGTTEAINLVAQTYGRKYIREGDEIVLTTLEHHANIVPWQMLAQEKGAVLKVVPISDRGEIILEEYARLLGPRTKIVAVSEVSNALGTIVPVKEMTEMAHRHNAKVLIDGAQAVSHLPVNVQYLDCDFYVFSGHKLFAPTGIGALYAKREILEDMPPWQGGGSMIRNVTFEKTTYSDPPEKFEAGTPNIADAIGLGAAIDYINKIGIVNIERYEQELTRYGIEKLSRVPGLRLIGTAPAKVGVFSFICQGLPTEEVGKRLAAEGIAVRAGHHCAQPALRRFGLEATVRPSVAFYNTKSEIDFLVDVLRRMPFG